jgi:hypothetical protein
VHDILALELGVQTLSDQYYFYNWNNQQLPGTYTYQIMCKNFLLAAPPAKPEAADEFIKDRISFIEQAFRLRGAQVAEANQRLPGEIAKAEISEKLAKSKGFGNAASQKPLLLQINATLNSAFDGLVSDLNGRLKLARYTFSYHNGLIQLSQDNVADKQIAQAFWPLVASPPWTNVDEQIKEAIDRRDRGDRTAAFHAVCALESAIKIISDQKGWTRGNEKGAANYIDNLVSAANGRFIEVWEGDALKGMFSDVRNPFAHGPGQAPMPTFNAQQADWAIDTAMAWIKSLMRRI